MKTGPFTPTPGDLFRWHYDLNDTCRTLSIFSRPTHSYVETECINILVSINETEIYFLALDKLHCVFIFDLDSIVLESERTHPRKCLILVICSSGGVMLEISHVMILFFLTGKYRVQVYFCCCLRQ